MPLLPVHECIETAPFINVAPGFSFPQSRSLDAEGALCQPYWGGLCLFIQEIIICMSLIYHTSYMDTEHMGLGLFWIKCLFQLPPLQLTGVM